MHIYSEVSLTVSQESIYRIAANQPNPICQILQALSRVLVKWKPLTQWSWALGCDSILWARQGYRRGSTLHWQANASNEGAGCLGERAGCGSKPAKCASRMIGPCIAPTDRSMCYCLPASRASSEWAECPHSLLGSPWCCFSSHHRWEGWMQCLGYMNITLMTHQHHTHDGPMSVTLTSVSLSVSWMMPALLGKALLPSTTGKAALVWNCLHRLRRMLQALYNVYTALMYNWHNVE